MNFLRFIKIFFLFVIPNILLKAQGFEATPLNKHFFEADPKFPQSIQYNEIKSINEDGSTFSQITDPKNHVIKTIQTITHPQSGRVEEVIDVFDEKGNLIRRSEEMEGSGKRLTYYYENGIQVAHVIEKGNDHFEIWRKSSSNQYKSKRNDFKPALFPNDREWKKFVMGERKFLSEAQKKGLEGTVVLAFLIDENGQRTKVEVANPYQTPDILREEALRIGNLFKGNYSPAINFNGETIESWLYLPVGFYFY